MKRFFTIACTVLGTALLLASCQKVAEIVKPDEKKTEGEVYMTVTAKDGVNTRTHIDGTAVKWSTDIAEKLKVFEVATPNEGDPVTTAKESSAGVTEDSGETMTFGVSFNERTEPSFDYYAIYPSSAYKSGNIVTGINLGTKAAQTPVDGSFDPTADLLIAQKYAAGSSQPTSMDMHFGRAVAVGKITIKNLGTDADVTKITFSAKKGGVSIPLAGSTTFDISSSTLPVTFANNTQDDAIILDCTELTDRDASGSDGMSAYFTCYPFTLNSDNPGTISVTVETATHRYTREGIVVNSAKGLSLKAGYASKFGVDMDGIDGEAKEVDLRYAYLDYDDFTTAGGTTSYGNVTATKAHGDSWVMYAIATNNAIGVRRNDNGQNDSYIKLPDLAEDIKSVVVTLKNVTAGKTITLESSATASNGSIASQTTTDATVYTFDLTSTSVKTAYFRSNGFQAQVEKIEVYSGTDTRSPIAAPATVTAALNSSVNNSIDVSWASVEGAGGYIITLVPDEGDDVVVKAASSPCTVTDLAYEMEYLVSVQAEPADYYLNTISAYTDASDIVTTGADSSGEVTLTTSDITMGDYTVQGTENGKFAYRLGTSSNNGSLTFGAGYSSITFKLEAYSNTPRTFSVTNGTINGDSALSPSAGAPSGTINEGFSRTDTGTEYTITVTDSTKPVVFSGRRGIVWGFTAVVADATTWDLKSIAVTTAPTKTTYEAGETFDPTGMVVTATYEDHDGVKDDKEEIVDLADLTLSPDIETALTTDDEAITITYEGKSTTQLITVTAPTIWDLKSIAVTTAPTKTTYVAGQTFDPTGMVVTATYEDHGGVKDDKAETVDLADLTLSPDTETPLTTDDEAITITYGGKSTTQAITVNAPSYDFETVAELNGLVTSDYVTYNGYLTNAVVSFVPATGTAFVKDSTGSVMIYKSNHGLKQGQTYTGAIEVTAIKYNNLYSEITAWDATFTGNETFVNPEVVTLSALIGHYDDYQNAYVSVSGLTVSSIDGKNINVTDGVNNYVVYDNPGTATCVAGDVITAVGTITKYQTTEELKVWKASDITVTATAPKAITFSQPASGGSFTVSVGGNNITSGTTVASGTTVTLTATPATDYEFTSWNVTGATVASASSAETTFTMGTSPVTISASFSSTGGGGQETHYYVKVTDLSTLSAGDKILLINTNHDALPAFTSTGTLSPTDLHTSKYDSTNDRFPTDDSTVDNCAITLVAPTTAIDNKVVFKLKMSNNYYIVKTATSGTGFNPDTTSDAESGDWTLTMDANYRVQFKHNLASATRGIVWRSGTQNKFGAYALSNINNTEYYNIAVYKLN